MVIAANLGFPRIGPGRELKQALEAHWSGDLAPQGLTRAASVIRRGNWELQRRLGLDHVPSSDFSLYDHVLDTAVMVGAVPGEYPPGRGPSTWPPISPWPGAGRCGAGTSRRSR